MSDYRLDFESVVGPGDTERLYNLLSIISSDDELEINIEDDDPEQTNTILEVLKSNNFDVLVHNNKNGRGHSIKAHRLS